MRNIFIITTLISLLSLPTWSESIEDLVERNGLYYKKFTDTPFTGEISGIQNGKFIKGKRVGRWILYHENGQLESKFNIKNEKLEGLVETYHSNGKLNQKGNYKDGKREGLWEHYYENGKLKSKGNYKDGEREVTLEYYDEDGKLLFKNDK